MKTVEEGRQRALSQTAGLEFQGFQQLRDQFGQGQSQIGQQLAGRGLFGSTVAGAQQAGLRGQYGRQVGQFASQLGGLRSQIEMNATGGRAQALSGLANLSSSTAGARAGIQSNIQFQAPQGIAESYGVLGSAIGGAADGWLDWSKNRKKPGYSNAVGSDGLTDFIRRP
jgi:hypothetical protein